MTDFPYFYQLKFRMNKIIKRTFKVIERDSINGQVNLLIYAIASPLGLKIITVIQGLSKRDGIEVWLCRHELHASLNT